MAEVRVFSEGTHVVDYVIDHPEWDADPGKDVTHRAAIEAEAMKRAVADGHLDEAQAAGATYSISEDPG